MNVNSFGYISKITDNDEWLKIIHNIDIPIINLYGDFHMEERFVILSNNNIISAFKYIDGENFGTIILLGKNLKIIYFIKIYINS